MVARGNLQKAVRRVDAWINETLGIGSDRDKRTHTKLREVWWLQQRTLEALYHSNDMAAVIVDALPEDAMREPWDLSLGDESENTSEVDAAARALGVREKLLEGWTLGRLYGGAAVLLGLDDGQDMDQPLDPERVRALRYLHPVSRWELTTQLWDDDPASPSFGLPLVYDVFPLTGHGAPHASVHRSRMLFFSGQRTPPALRMENNGWHASVLQRPFEVLQDFGVSWAAAAHLLSDASQAVWKIQGLHDMIASGDDDTLAKRQMMADRGRSVGKGVWLDAESEGFERVATPMEGLPQTLQLFIQRLAGAARMPATILMGQSPAGMNATGESDIRWWYNRVESAQENELKPRLEHVYQLLMTSLGVAIPDEWGVTFRPLHKATEAERAEVELKRAQRDKVYVDTGVVQPEEVALSRFKGNADWDRVDLDAREQLLKEGTPDEGDGLEDGGGTPAEEDTPPDEDDDENGGQRGDALRNDVVRKRGGQWCVITESGRNMGCYDTKAEAEERLEQIKRFR